MEDEQRGTARAKAAGGSPGRLREAHAHIAALGEAMSLCDLSGCRSVGECLDAVERGAAASSGAWVRLKGARVEAWREARWPTREELDRAVERGRKGGRSRASGSGTAGRAHKEEGGVVVMSFDHHSATASSGALRAAGIEPGAGGTRAVGENGVVVRDAGTGEATGLLLEDAAWAVWRAAPEASAEARRGQVRDALAHLRGLGYREVHDMLAQDWLGETIADLVASGEAAGWESIRLYPPMDRFAALLASSGRLGGKGWEAAGRGVVRLAGGKLFADGTLNSRTALMLTPYADHAGAGSAGHRPQNFGTAMITPERIEAAMEETARAGLHLAVHAIGDGAVRMVLDAAERVRKRGGGAALGSGRTARLPDDAGGDGEGGSHRIEHAEIIDESDVGRFVRLGVVCSVQPCHLLYDIEVLRRHLGHRLDRVLPLRELIDSGLRPGRDLVFGSDTPIVRADAEDSVVAATTRRRAGMAAEEAIAPRQAISEREAWACFGAEDGAGCGAAVNNGG